MAELPHPYGYAIFCDDFRMEMGGKYSLMGIYRGTMIINVALPVALPKLCIMATYCEARETALKRTGNMHMRVFLPENDENNPAIDVAVPLDQARDQPQVDYQDPDIMPLMRVDIPLVLQPFLITAPGIIKVRCFIQDEVTRIGALRIDIHSPLDNQQSA